MAGKTGFEVFGELEEITKQLSPLLDAMIANNCMENPAYVMVSTMSIMKVLENANGLLDALEGYVGILKQICVEEGIDVPEPKDDDEPFTMDGWATIWNPKRRVK